LEAYGTLFLTVGNTFCHCKLGPTSNARESMAPANQVICYDLPSIEWHS
jgi:hypothetical protein